jgi:hypothetical protein
MSYAHDLTRHEAKHCIKQGLSPVFINLRTKAGFVIRIRRMCRGWPLRNPIALKDTQAQAFAAISQPLNVAVWLVVAARGCTIDAMEICQQRG